MMWLLVVNDDGGVIVQVHLQYISTQHHTYDLQLSPPPYIPTGAATSTNLHPFHHKIYPAPPTPQPPLSLRSLPLL
ncbi:hypothetical protein FRX31_029183 [Thalictrum thalictroides]|uniref:Uncharacterized protein n=1 Tax=Thalictrum thalictroides TaxID=46969 RepID=A0A7J6V9F0_THATH|nr:hypothetical protein FRX31_029183 [Thalictrum thalictroides]